MIKNYLSSIGKNQEFTTEEIEKIDLRAKNLLIAYSGLEQSSRYKIISSNLPLKVKIRKLDKYFLNYAKQVSRLVRMRMTRVYRTWLLDLSKPVKFNYFTCKRRSEL